VTDRYQLLPDLTPDEYAALKADIVEHGMLVPIVVDADSGAILDGHHRLRAWNELRAEGAEVPDYPREVRSYADDSERIAHVLALNLYRRHLSRERRAELVATLRETGWSLRRIGKVIGANSETVRRDLISVANATPRRVLGADGKSYPAQRANDGPVPSFAPIPSGEVPRLDRRAPVTCPACGHEFLLPR
jgi:ParB-like chromosome segregation protein Spo0J